MPYRLSAARQVPRRGFDWGEMALRRVPRHTRGRVTRLRARKSKQRQELAAVHAASLCGNGYEMSSGRRRNAARSERYCFSNAVVIVSSTSSETIGTKVVRPQSERLIFAVPSKPTVSLLPIMEL